MKVERWSLMRNLVKKREDCDAEQDVSERGCY